MIRKLLRAPPIERPFKGRTYGLVLFPQLFESLQRIPGIFTLDLADCKFISLSYSQSAPVPQLQSFAKTEYKILEPRKSHSQPVSFAVTQSSASDLQTDVPPETARVWDKLRVEEVKSLAAKVCVGPGTLPYLFDLAERRNDEAAFKLCGVVSEIMQDLKQPQPQQVKLPTPMKPSLKQKEYLINYNAKLRTKAQRDAARKVTYRDLEERQNYIATQIRTGNEIFEREMRSLSQGPLPERQRKVKLSDTPNYLNLISPSQVLQNGAFAKTI